MYSNAVTSFAWCVICSAAYVVSGDYSYGQTPQESPNPQAYRVNAYQKFILANTYLFDDDARPSYLYAYDPATWKGTELAIEPWFLVLAPSQETTRWWTEPSYHIVELDSYTVCADSEDKLSCVREHGAFLATSRKYPELEHDDLFVIKEGMYEMPIGPQGEIPGQWWGERDSDRVTEDGGRDTSGHE